LTRAQVQTGDNTLHLGCLELPLGAFPVVLTLDADPFMAELWAHDLRFVETGAGREHLKDAARQQEIFLDYFLANAAQNAVHLLDESYDAILTDDERTLRNELNDFASNVPEAVKVSAAWEPIRRVLGELGAGPDPALS